MKKKRITGGLKRNPVRAGLAFATLVFWLFTPLVAQKYFNYSAVNTSFAIIVIYFVVWKLYEHREEIRTYLNS